MNPCIAPVCTPQCAGKESDAAGRVRVFARLSALVLALVFGPVVIAVVASIPGHRRDRRGAWALQHVSRWILRAVGVRLTIDGAPRSGPSLVVGNHVSWLDVLALSASAPMQMVAKLEVKSWPVIGGAAVRAGTLFLQRERLRELPMTVAAIAAALRSGSRVQVFPEGTTRCGSALNPFRRAAFQAAIDAGVVVSPVALCYLDDRGVRTPAPAFLGDETLLTSIRRVLALPGLTARVHWLPAIPAIAGTGRDHIDRARVARLVENAVARDLRIPVVRRLPARASRAPAVAGLEHAIPVRVSARGTPDRRSA